jgi:hypothetical protein
MSLTVHLKRGASCIEDDKRLISYAHSADIKILHIKSNTVILNGSHRGPGGGFG